MKIKAFVRNLLLRFKWRKMCHISITADISLSSSFEGMSKIDSRVTFHGHLGLGSYIGSDSFLSADIGRFTSIAPYVRCNHGMHPYKIPYATTSPRFFSLSKQNGLTFASRQMFSELRYADEKRKIAIKIGNDCWIGEGAFIGKQSKKGY